MVNSKHAFWQALIFALIIFAIGFALGFFLEEQRTDKMHLNLIYSEINIVDEQLRNKALEEFNLDCESAIKSTFEFADKIYNEARKLEKYDASSTFTDTLTILHRRYDLLRLMLWTESIKLKKRCNANFHTLVYFFDYNIEDIDKQSKQTLFSRILTDTKEEYSDKILLIPIAKNLNLDSIDLITKSFNITSTPAILIDEEILIKDIITLEELEKAIFKKENIEKIILYPKK